MRNRAPKKDPIAAGVEAAVASQQQVQPGVAELQLIGQYVKDKVAKEDPATRAVLDAHFERCFSEIARAMGVGG